MIHVCSLARLYDTVEETGARHVVTLLKDTDRVAAPARPSRRPTISCWAWTTSSSPMDGYVIPCDEHVDRLIDFVRGWDRAKPMVVHCYAGISRSTAGAFVAACALNPAPRRNGDRARAAPRLADRHAQCAHRRRSPTACSAATAAWSRRSMRSAAARWPTKAARSGSTWNRAAPPASPCRLSLLITVK